MGLPGNGRMGGERVIQWFIVNEGHDLHAGQRLIGLEIHDPAGDGGDAIG